MQREVKQSNALSQSDKRLACLSNKPHPRLFFAKNLHTPNLRLSVNAP